MGSLLKIHELTKIFPGQVALDGVDLKLKLVPPMLLSDKTDQENQH